MREFVLNFRLKR